MVRPPRLSARQAATLIVRQLQEAGHVAYFAGGCVRDELLGLEPKDYDVATDARPQRVRQLFPRSRLVGEAFGVVLVRAGGHDIEVATFRAEWGYADGRHPEHVQFTDAQHDALRRDFTINGLFEDPLAPPEVPPEPPEVSPETSPEAPPEPSNSTAPTAGPPGRIIDYVDGQADLNAGLIRAIGQPELRFAEDYLRLLRAVRFAARLGFAIEAQTAAAIARHARDLGRISRERIGLEVQAMLTGPRPARAARLAQDLGLDGPTLTEELATVPLPTLEALAKLSTPTDYATALAAWMLDRHLVPALTALPAAGPEGSLVRLQAVVESLVPHRSSPRVDRWRRALVLSNDVRDQLHGTLELLPVALAWRELSVARRKRLLARPFWPRTQRLLEALAEQGAALLVAEIATQSRPLIDEGVAPAPLVSGDDLIAQGRRPGPEFRRLLEAAYDAQLEGRLHSREDALAWLRQQG